MELLDYFWKNNDLHYRGLVATGKDKLNHAKYNNDNYDLWYYKMYFRTLDPIIRQENEYHILVDIKDTTSYRTYQGEIDEGKTLEEIFLSLTSEEAD